MTALPCPVCGTIAHDKLVLVRAVPLIGCQIAASRAEALAVGRGDLDIVACRECHHVFNRAFEPERIAYRQGYENSLGFSRRHRAHIDTIVSSLIERYDLRSKTVVEIGCGSADFLRQLCAAGRNRGIGYDPSQPSQPAVPAGNGSVEIVGTSFGDAAPGIVDAICAQHVLEHLRQPVETLRWARAHLVAGGVGYFEVPNADTIFRNLNIWDLTYEHVSYFSPGSLRRALTEAGFSVLHVESTFGGQYLDAEAIAEPHSVSMPATETFDGFPASFARAMAFWRKQVSEWREARQKVVLWGAGTKAVAFLNMLGIRAGYGIDYVVDINPRKPGRYIPGTGQCIVPPEFLREYRPEWVVVMNPEYRSEIEAQLRELQVGGTVIQSVLADPCLA
ncbi:MAG TPA: class I SAM-dependent methyltransferase [Xanthobacteraceae bacterium]|nr:class I SAM-dependent methyltransferase [Xanthobacteraceae bacterium]